MTVVLIFVIMLMLFVVPWDPIPLSLMPCKWKHLLRLNTVDLLPGRILMFLLGSFGDRNCLVTESSWLLWWTHLKGEMIRSASWGWVYLNCSCFHCITDQHCFVDIFCEDTTLHNFIVLMQISDLHTNDWKKLIVFKSKKITPEVRNCSHCNGGFLLQ